ncbi:MAG: hypothetical protein PHU25_18370 [Deltaproteobacteria bacterium]|nr:hypothetical protein [Deltaproteobacteria bacterium]
MDEAKKVFQPWQLILILVCVVAFGGGLYLLNGAIESRFDSLDTAVTGGTDTAIKAIERVDTKVVAVQDALKAMEAKMAAPVAAPAPVAPAEGVAAVPAEGAAKPVAKPAPAAEKKVEKKAEKK